MQFDPDALLAALPKRQIMPVRGGRIRPSSIDPPTASALGQKGEYNGFTGRERDRTAELSKRLIKEGATIRYATCDICGAIADHEHAENYYDLTRWIGMCKQCHVHALHKRFTNPRKWSALLDLHELPETHWSRLVSPRPFDLAQLLRGRGAREPRLGDFTA
jgi:hypothetical protein